VQANVGPSRRTRLLGIAAALSALLLAACGGGSGGATATAVPGTPTPATSATPSPPQLSTAAAPWPAPPNELALIRLAGLEPTGQPSTNVHYHAHLDVFLNGNAVPVPPGIGLDETSRQSSPLLTKDPTGIIHVESRLPGTFTLGQFFTQWGVRFSETCVGAYCAPATPLKLYVNGVEVTTPPQAHVIEARQEICIVIGQPPAQIPSRYTFPAGL
jgi:hypothetical protein